MHFIGFASIDFSYTTMPVRIFSPKRAILGYLPIYTLNLIEHKLYCFNLFSIDRKQRTDVTGLETKYDFSGTYYHSVSELP